ncbi:GNAT family N-acetyltransferase [Streptobacillus felis]|uniref:GNAT family N-acetyltransferase n=1 Tax=Streptobacillus felis TaxID=1384509 RepID=A0A7Z0PGQ9_9FUSO|nr:GNAT family N-acetyltransferase [Streptobacillus felis]NYV27945.1 GNAT family N-acetyltransferase [Streptobacillus felis]
MPIQGIKQPEILNIDDDLRLVKFHKDFSFALKLYQDLETVWLVDGEKEIYDEALLERMYSYLESIGELYFIYYKIEGEYKPIGDVTFSKEYMPIVIGEKEFRGKGIRKKIISALINRAKDLGYDKIEVNEIYYFNNNSKKLFTSLGFKEHIKRDKGMGYILNLK